jgi:hypothetical protein
MAAQTSIQKSSSACHLQDLRLILVPMSPRAPILCQMMQMEAHPAQERILRLSLQAPLMPHRIHLEAHAVQEMVVLHKIRLAMCFQPAMVAQGTQLVKQVTQKTPVRIST